MALNLVRSYKEVQKLCIIFLCQVKGLWRACGTRTGVISTAATGMRSPLAARVSYSCGNVPLPITTLTEDEKMMKETGESAWSSFKTTKCMLIFFSF